MRLYCRHTFVSSNKQNRLFTIKLYVMLGPDKYWLFVFGSAILGGTLFPFHVRGGEPVEPDLFSGKKTATVETVHVKVTNQYGKVIMTDFKTPTDDHIDFNLESLPIGDYSVEVHQGNKMINSTDMRNVSSNEEVLTVEILNSKGNQVYESTNPNDVYDLTSMGKGSYTVNVYKGENLINTRKLKN